MNLCKVYIDCKNFKTTSALIDVKTNDSISVSYKERNHSTMIGDLKSNSSSGNVKVAYSEFNNAVDIHVTSGNRKRKHS